MNRYIYHFIVTIPLYFAACNGKHGAAESDPHAHDHEAGSHATEEVVHFVNYTDSLEIYIVGSPMVSGKDVDLAVHLTGLASFKPIEADSLRFDINLSGKVYSFQAQSSGAKGIFLIPVKFDAHGKANAKFTFSWNGQHHSVNLGNLNVYHCEHDWEEDHVHELNGNTIKFSKEQAWAVDFATELVALQPLGQVVQTTGRVMPAQQDEQVLVAGISGVIDFTGKQLLPGMGVKKSETLLRISSRGGSDDNFSIRFAETKSRFELAQSTYERLKALAVENVVSAAELDRARTEYEVAQAAYQAIVKDNSLEGLILTSPLNGEVTAVMVRNGDFVSVGQPLIKLAGSKSQQIQCYVQPRFARLISSLSDANIRVSSTATVLNIGTLAGRIVAAGKSITADNHLLPVTLEIPYTDKLTNGDFVEVFLLCKPDRSAIAVPKTSILEEQGNYFVIVQLQPELFEKREVKLGGSDGLRVQVVSGLRVGERIVTRGAIYVKMAQSSGMLDAHSGHVH